LCYKPAEPTVARRGKLPSRGFADQTAPSGCGMAHGSERLMLDINGFLTSTEFLATLASAIAGLITQFFAVLFGLTDLFAVVP